MWSSDSVPNKAELGPDSVGAARMEGLMKIAASVVFFALFVGGALASFSDEANGKSWSAGFVSGLGIAAFIIVNAL